MSKPLAPRLLQDFLLQPIVHQAADYVSWGVCILPSRAQSPVDPFHRDGCVRGPIENRVEKASYRLENLFSFDCLRHPPHTQVMAPAPVLQVLQMAVNLPVLDYMGVNFRRRALEDQIMILHHSFSIRDPVIQCTAVKAQFSNDG